MYVSSLAERLFAGRWIAGPDVGDAVRVSRRMNNLNISAMLNYLGEDIADRSAVRDSVTTYLELMRAVNKEGISASISLKPSQIGMGISYALAKGNYSRIVGRARKLGIFVWLDMESHGTVDDTMRMYRAQMKGRGTGICLQAYLRRSIHDAERITGAGGIIRLVKGAYKEGPDTAFQTRAETTMNYAVLMRYLFKNAGKFMVATHDPKMLKLAFMLGRSTNKKPAYAMLNGIRNNYAARLARREDVSLYLPFGKAWMPFVSRRLREEGHLLLILRSFFESQDLVKA